MAEDVGHLITLFVSYLCKFFIISYLEARGAEPLFPTLMSRRGDSSTHYVISGLVNPISISKRNPVFEGLAHPRRLRITSQTVSSTLTRAYRLQLDSTIVHGACGVVVRCNISSTASRY
jgi:hypothetical protein